MSHQFKVVEFPIEHSGKILSMSDEELAEVGGVRLIADMKPGYPCVVSLVDAEVGESVIAISYQHLATSSPYQSAGPIFVRESAKTAIMEVGKIPEFLKFRDLAVRAYDESAMMIGADLLRGDHLADKIDALFQNSSVATIHVHIAGPGCFNCEVVRA
jgi:hypothetical protein